MPEKIRVAIVIGMFHSDIAEEMLKRMKIRAGELGVEVAKTIRVPCSYETPLAAKRLLEKSDIDCVVVSGFIEKGHTMHGEQMGLVVSRLIKKMELQYNKPVGMGIIGPGATEEQAKKRLNYGAAAVDAAVKMVGILREL